MYSQVESAHTHTYYHTHTHLQARAGVSSTVDVLRLIGSFAQETSYTVWESLATNMASIARVFSYTGCYEDFKKFAHKLLAPTFVRLGWESKDADSKDVFTKINFELLDNQKTLLIVIHGCLTSNEN